MSWTPCLNCFSVPLLENCFLDCPWQPPACLPEAGLVPDLAASPSNWSVFQGYLMAAWWSSHRCSMYSCHVWLQTVDFICDFSYVPLMNSKQIRSSNCFFIILPLDCSVQYLIDPWPSASSGETSPPLTSLSGTLVRAAELDVSLV